MLAPGRAPREPPFAIPNANVVKVGDPIHLVIGLNEIHSLAYQRNKKSIPRGASPRYTFPFI
jgi:hypothetical protein